MKQLTVDMEELRIVIIFLLILLVCFINSVNYNVVLYHA